MFDIKKESKDANKIVLQLKSNVCHVFRDADPGGFGLHNYDC